MKIARRLYGSMLLFSTFAIFSLSSQLHAAGLVEPGGDNGATALALSNPAEYAWRLFFFLNNQAKSSAAGVVDETKPFGILDPGASVVWETWAMASGGDASESYPQNGARPVSWDELKRDKRTLTLDRNLEQLSVLSQSKRLKPLFFPTEPHDQEVRQNRFTYEFIISNEMYHRGGLEALLAKAQVNSSRSQINFPNGAKEVKAQWYPITEADKPRYLWREVKNGDGSATAYGLVALHIITKDLPNWFWADFGHVDCEVQKGACDPASLKKFLGDDFFQEEAKTVAVDPTTRGAAAPKGSNGVRSETVGTLWQNYILRGTQTEFATGFGRATILSNPVIENGFQNSSCMSCHARASVGARKVGSAGVPSSLLNTLSPGDPTLGVPDAALFGAAPGQDSINYLQTDFIWSAPFRAQRKPGT
ncbi:hypothetical protein HFN49_00030 [Rhizobium leguminosarum]|uniref:hypothetical protein n=1 Tax=Rhizobium ruizarguesonis TaxID=2081791 RepID=UPI001A9A2B48|nr:hypothetical protein [Rhizobium ruizarguesonis]MBY5884588.1 hypothetical protein [Rhizobium leguminosarum]QSZ05153.1 hypothetical protein J3P73_31590 [Rhizobium ruizarguesonis]